MPLLTLLNKGFMKVIFILIEAAVAFAAMYFVLSQILLPAMFGTKLFPFFSKEKQIKDEIIDLNQSLHEKEMGAVRDKLRDQLENPEESSSAPETNPTPESEQKK